MKILKIYIQNLNSLKGEFSIDFEQPPLKNAGLFLISGKTGAGKTTILDAITLALFGDAPRFDDVKGKQSAEMMTHGTTESSAEVTFSTQSGIFVAKWRMRRTRKGNLERTAYRELMQILPNDETKVIAVKIKEVDAEIEQLLGGLNFNRFKRSIMLAQGDFAQFLRGTEDRSDILERITDTALYSEISKHAHLRHREEEKKLEQFQQQLSHTQLLSKEEVEELKTQQSEKESLSENYRAAIDKYGVGIQWYEVEKEIKKAKETAETKLKSLAEEKEGMQEELAKLDLHLKALPLQPELQNLERQQLALSKLVHEIRELEESKIQITQNLATKSNQLETKQAIAQALDNEMVEQEPIWDQVKSLDLDIETHEKSRKQLKLESDACVKQVTLKNKEIEELNTKVAALSPEIESLSEWLSQNEVDKRILNNSIFVELGKSNKEQEFLSQNTATKAIELSSIESSFKEKEKEVKRKETEKIKYEKVLLETQNALSKQIAAFDESLMEASIEDVLFELQGQLDDLSEQLLAFKELEEILADRALILDKLEELSENKLAIDTALENIDYYSLQLYEQKIVLEEEIEYQNSLCEALQNNISLDEHRLLLKENCPCPLCGAEEHPYIKTGMNKAVFDSKFAKEKQKLSRLQVEKKAKEEEFWKQQNYANEIDQNKKLLERESELHQSLWLDMETKAIKLFRNNPQLPEEAIEYTDAEFQREIQAYNNKFDSFSTLKSFLEKGNADCISLRAKQETAEQMLALFQKDLEQIEMKLGLQKTALQSAEQAQEELLSKINMQLEGIHPPLTKSKNLQSAIKKLEKSKLQFLEKQDSLLEKQKEKNELESKLNTQNSLLEQLANQHKVLEGKLKVEQAALEVLRADRTAIFEDKDPNTERQKLKDKQLALKKELIALEIAKNQYTSDLQAKGNLLEDKLKSKDNLQNEYELSLLNLNQKAADTGFEDLLSLRHAILPDNTAQSIGQQQKELEKQLEKQLSDLNLADNKLASHLAEQPDSQSFEELLLLKKEAETARESVLEEIGRLKQRLQEQANLEKTQRSLLDKIAAQKIELQRWKQLYDLIGHAEGKKFRQFAQNITLNKLIHLANKHLHQFASGRYLLEKREEDSLEIDIIDTFQANNKRPLNTLSGGETFLASLSLALGLSDLAGGRAHIESLFIDEGFGTLDHDTLQVALRALQILQSQGKTIGIISHVPQLQERIEVQIKVQKKSGGNSVIEY